MWGGSGKSSSEETRGAHLLVTCRVIFNWEQESQTEASTLGLRKRPPGGLEEITPESKRKAFEERGACLSCRTASCNADVSTRTYNLKAGESKQGGGSEWESIPGGVSEQTVKHGSHRECLMYIKMRVMKGRGKSRAKRQSLKGSKTRVRFGGCVVVTRMLFSSLNLDCFRWGRTRNNHKWNSWITVRLQLRYVEGIFTGATECFFSIEWGFRGQ